MHKSLLPKIKSLIKPFILLVGIIFRKSESADSTHKKLSGTLPEFAVNHDNNYLCDGCGLCKNVCPCKDAIQIKNKTDAEGALFFEYTIDKSICILCGQCIEYCPQQALNFSDKYPESVTDKNSLITEIIIK